MITDEIRAVLKRRMGLLWGGKCWQEECQKYYILQQLDGWEETILEYRKRT